MSKILRQSVSLLFSSLFALTAVTLPASAQGDFPKRIISLGPAVTEELYLLGAQDRLVGVTVYCLNPPEALKKDRVGTVTGVNVEKIAALKPELVLATSLTDPRDIERLKNLKIRVEVFAQAETFPGLCDEFLRLGRLVGKEETALKIVREATAAVEGVKASLAGLRPTRTFVQIGANPLFTATRGSFINDFVEFAGGINIAGDSPSGLYSREKVIEANPDVILIVLMGISGKEEQSAWEKFPVLNAVRTGRVHVLDSYAVCSPTPVTFVKGVRDIAGILHPGLEVRE